MAVTCRVLGISRQAYYQWESDPVSQRDWDDAHLINAALEIHTDDPTEGYRFIADELARRGFAASENRVWRICSMQKIFSLHAKKKARNPKAGPPVHDDLVDRDFTATAPNTKWLTDITEHSTAEGKLYLCAVKDCYSNRIVGYSIGPRMRSSLAVAALRNAIALRNPQGVIVHSDRGSQFRSRSYRRLLRSHGLTGSMGRVGACGDNAASANSPQSSLRPSTPPLQRPDTTQPRVSTKSWAVPFRQATRRRGHFPNEAAAVKVLYLVITNPIKNRANITGKTLGWKQALNTLAMYYGDRINAQ